jgi:large conductance mechanosensitive channel
VTINYGLFINNIITFIIVALVMFFLIRGMNNLYMRRQKGEAEEEAPTTKPCPYCKETIAIDATRCSHCTSELS